MTETSAPHGFQYTDARHETETAISGMWLFLATEALFFGPLILSWIFCRHWNMSGFDAGAQHTELLLGTLNTLLLVTSSFAYSAGLAFIEAGNKRRLVQCCVIAWLLGAAFLAIKFGIEWRHDFEEGFFPGSRFSIAGTARQGAQLFFAFYFLGTGIHGLHLVVGLILLGWIMSNARAFSSVQHRAVSIVGLYWSFVDMIWVILYPLIYLIGRSP